MQYEGHLTLHEIELKASEEREFTPAGWRVLRLSRGAGYCFEGRQVTEVATDDLLLMPPGRTVLFRASGVGDAQLQYFDFQPELLGSFLSLPERQQFAMLATSRDLSARHFPASDEAARQFAAICDAHARSNQLYERGRLVALMGALFSPQLKGAHEAQPSRFTAEARFEEMVEQTPEAELLRSSAEELARRCRCSSRHFIRLFRSHFGVSFRSRQVQLRMENARQLLLETDSRVCEIAATCGYRRRSLFNWMFKKHFGVTPTELRRTAGHHRNGTKGNGVKP